LSSYLQGIDVFGRGTYGGGGWQCEVALKSIRDAGISCGSKLHLSMPIFHIPALDS
jgi:hypothetical protein